MGQETIQIVATAQDRASPALKGLRSNIAALGSKSAGPMGGMLSGMAGITAGAFTGAAAFSMLTSALQGAGEWLGKGAQSAIDQEKQIAILGQTIKDNVPNWDGYTEAINAQLESMQKLGFTDDDLRTAYGHLIVQTHSLGTAFDQLNIATDVAHARNMDLTEAADLINKAMLGNTRAFKTLGIDITGATTPLERLTLLQKAFAGSTAAYLTTTAGKMDEANIKLSEFQEQVGGTLIPLIGQFATVASDEIDNVSTAFSGLTDAAQHFFNLMSGTGPGMVPDSIAKGIVPEIAQNIAGGESTALVGNAFGSLFQSASRIAQNEVATAATDTGNIFATNLADALRGNRKFVKDAMHDMMWALNHPQALANQMRRINAALQSPQLAALLNGNSMQRIIGQQIQGQLQGQQASLTTANYDSGVSSIVGAINSLKPLLDSRYGAQGPPSMSQVGYSQYAKGGYIAPGKWGQTGEQGPEMVYGGKTGATVVPHGGGHGHNIILNGRLVGQAMDEYLGAQMALSPSGIISRG